MGMNTQEGNICSNLSNRLFNIKKIIMMSARTIIGNYCYKKSIGYILGKCKMFDISIMIAQSCLKLFHKMIHHQKPKSIFNLYLGRNKRKTTKIIRTIYIPKSKKLCNHFIYKVPKMYNKIPNPIKDTNFKI